MQGFVEFADLIERADFIFIGEQQINLGDQLFEFITKTINAEGLRRRGFESAEISELRRAFKILYRQGLTLDVALERLQSMVEETPSVQTLIDSLEQSQRGIVR